jgi:hypothetical protein
VKDLIAPDSSTARAGSAVTSSAASEHDGDEALAEPNDLGPGYSSPPISTHVSPQPKPESGVRDERRCVHLREDGERCRGWRVRGESLCAGHLGRGIAGNPQEAARLAAAKSAEVRHARAEERKMTLQDRLAAALERNAEKIEARLLAIIDNGNDADALRAIHEWTNRVYGRPTERVEQVTAESETERELREMSREERTAALIELERKQHAA